MKYRLVLFLSLLGIPSVGVANDFLCAGHAFPPVYPGIAAKLVGSPASVLPAQGQVHVLVVFAQFKDEAPHGQRVPDDAAQLFDPELQGSLTHFYRTMSFGQFTVAGTVLPRRYSSKEPAAAYLAKEPGENGEFGRFVLEILEQVDRDIDFALFDNDGPDGLPDSGDDDGMVLEDLHAGGVVFKIPLRVESTTAVLFQQEYLSHEYLLLETPHSHRDLVQPPSAGRGGTDLAHPAPCQKQ